MGHKAPSNSDHDPLRMFTQSMLGSFKKSGGSPVQAYFGEKGPD